MATETETETMREILDSVSGVQNKLDENINEGSSDNKISANSTVTPKSLCRWTPTSSDLLAQAETRVLSRLKNPYKGQLVNIGPVVGKKDCQIWTISMNPQGQGTPLVLLHGFGAGVAFWSLNLDTLSATRPVYAIDHLGFGRSSRPKFSTDPQEAERQFVTAIEEWRKQLKLEKFVLLGHSFGGYLAMSYSMSFPERVAHLILADPWGFQQRPKNLVRKLPIWIQALAFVARPFNPFAIVRAAGPMGQTLLERARPDLMNKFSELNENGEDIKFGDYVYHANAQTPSGEEAFKNMAINYGWSKFPMLLRMADLDSKICITAIYGSVSWIDKIPLEVFLDLRPSSYINVKTLEGAGHHVYSDGKDEFNEIILTSCDMADNLKN